MGCCTDLAGNSSCGFHYSGLPCPLESQPLNAPYAIAFDTVLFESLSLSDPPAPPFIRKVPPPNCPFLALPGEIRNRIYQYTLVIARPYAVQLRWDRPLDTALFRVNKQISHEASSIFYAENTFRFPEALFVGAPILQQLQTLYRISRPKLKMMRDVVLDVPVYGPTSNYRLRLQTVYNLRHMTELLAPSPKMKVKLRVGYVWGEKGHDLGPSEYRYTLATALESLRLNGVVTDVHIRTHPKFMDEWVDILSREFEDRWSIEAMIPPGSVPQQRIPLAIINRFSDRYQMPGLVEFYEEAWTTSWYIFKPRRVSSSGVYSKTIA